MPANDAHRSRSRLPHWGLIALAAVVLAALGVPYWIGLPYEREQRVIQEIDRLGGQASYTTKVGPKWLQQFIGRDGMRYFAMVNGIRLTKTRVTDEDLRHLAGLSKLRWLELSETAVSDRGVAHIAQMKQLEQLDLRQTEVTNAGVAKLRTALPACRITRY